MTHPHDEILSHVGQEISTGDLFRAAWANWKRNFWPALGYALLAGLIVGAAMMAASCVIMMPISMGMLAAAASAKSPAAAMGAQLASQLIQSVITGAGAALLAFPLYAGYQWSLVCTYDGRSMEAGDLFSGFRLRYKTLASLGGLQALATVAVQLAFFVALMGTVAGGIGAASPRSPLPVAIPIAASAIALAGVQGLIIILIQMLFFLTPYFAFAQQSPTWRSCLRYNWQVLRSRTPQFLLVFFFPLIAGAIAGLAFLILAGLTALLLLIGSTAATAVAVLLFVIEGLGWLVCVVGGSVYMAFLYAAFFRASYGYTLEVPAPADGAPIGLAET